jgi:hypothetical protein
MTASTASDGHAKGTEIKGTNRHDDRAGCRIEFAPATVGTR